MPLTHSPAPWRVTDDGTVIAADGHVVCVLGYPEDGMAEQNITNGAAIRAVPAMLAALKRISACPTRGTGDIGTAALNGVKRIADAAIALALMGELL